MWVPPECKDPVVLHHPTRKSVGFFGAMRLRDGKLVYKRETNSFNAETYWGFMKKLRQRSCHSGRRVLVLADNARYHHAKLHAKWRKMFKQICSVVSTALQSRVEPNRTSLEADKAIGNP